MASPFVSVHVVSSGEEDQSDEIFNSNPSSEDESDDVGPSSKVTKSEELPSNTINVTEKPDGDEENGKNKVGHRGWATAMAKVLQLNEEKVKRTRNKKSVILAKGKTDREIDERKRKKEQEELKKRSEFEVVAEDGEKGESSKSDLKDQEPKAKSSKEIIREIAERRLMKRRWEDLGHVKPDIVTREKEKFFQRVATAGVVQLFNAVKQRQLELGTKLEKVGKSEVKREKVMKSMTKGDFLDALKGAKSVEPPMAKKQNKKNGNNVEKTEKPGWNVLSDKFMMKAKMTDWGKESESDNDEAKNVPDSNDEMSDN